MRRIKGKLYDDTRSETQRELFPDFRRREKLGMWTRFLEPLSDRVERTHGIAEPEEWDSCGRAKK